jgi:hypothetical protein
MTSTKSELSDAVHLSFMHLKDSRSWGINFAAKTFSFVTNSGEPSSVTSSDTPQNSRRSTSQRIVPPKALRKTKRFEPTRRGTMLKATVQTKAMMWIVKTRQQHGLVEGFYTRKLGTCRHMNVKRFLQQPTSSRVSFLTFGLQFKAFNLIKVVL